MSGIDVKSIGFLVDSLITTNLRCWFAQEEIMDESLSETERLAAAIRAQETNDKRNQLIRAIDLRLGEGNISPEAKSYHTYFENKK